MTTQALLNFNGVSGAADFTDDTGLQTWSVESGTPLLSDVEAAFGTTSLNVLGDSSISCVLTNSLVGDFTIEAFINVGATTTTDRCIINLIGGGAEFQVDKTANFVGVYNPIDGFYIQYHVASEITSIPWSRMVIERKDGFVKVYLNGISTQTPFEWFDEVTGIKIGEGNIGNYFNGYIDSVRIIDEAIYNSNLTKEVFEEPTLSYSVNELGLSSFNDVSNITDRIIKSFTGELSIIHAESVIVVPDPIPTTTNIISGNVKKFGLPYALNLVAVTVELNPSVVGQTVSDEITGDYSMDIWPWVGDTLIYATPNYGNAFSDGAFLASDEIIHPTIPNRNIYIAQNDGTLGSPEPTWPESGTIVSGTVTLLAIPLYRPLINGFIKPTVTPI